MQQFLGRSDRWLLGLDLVLAALAALCIGAMMVLTAVDVVMRYALNQPLSWAYDLTMNYLLVASFFFGLSYTLRMNHHISVDFFARRLPKRVYHMGMALGCLGAMAIFAAVAWFGLRDTIHAFVNDEVIFGALIWPMWVSKAVVPIGMAPLALRCLHRAVGHLAFATDDVVQARLGLQLDQHSEVEV